MKPDAEGIMKLPEKGRIDFSEHFIKERLFTNGIDHRLINNERQLENILQSIDDAEANKLKQKADKIGLNDPSKNKFMQKPGEVIEVDFDKGRWKDMDPEKKAGGGSAGLNYLLAEDENERMPYGGGGVGKPPVTFYFDMQGGAGKEAQNIYGVKGLNQKGYDYGGKLAADTTFPLLGGELSVGGELGFGRNKSNVDYKGKPIDWLSHVGETKLGDDWNVGLKWSKKFNSGGRVPYEEGKKVGRPKGQFWTTGKGGGEDVVDLGFDELSADEWLFILKAAMAGDYGPIDYANGGRAGYKDGKGPKMSRRNFLKIMGGIAALPVVGKFFKFAKPAAKAAKVADLTSVPIKNIEGMPSWFKPLVNKVIKEGDDVSKRFATQERQIVHKTKLPDSQTDVVVTQDLNNGNVSVELGLEKHGFASGKFGQPVRLEYKASEKIEPVINSWTGKVHTKGKKTPEEFNVEEAEFTGAHPENIKFEESTINKFGEHGSNFSEVEKFATGKVTKSSKGTKQVWEADWDDSLPDDVDMASGGRVPRSGGGIMKILKLFKTKPETLKEFIDRRNFLKLMIGNTDNMKNKRLLQEILEENEKVKGFEFPESGIGSDIHKEIETILSKDITKHANGGLAKMLGEE